MKKLKYRTTTYYKYIIFVVILTFLMLINITPVFAWFDNVDQTSFLKTYKGYLNYANGPFSILGNTVLWWLIKGSYWLCKSIEGLVPETLSLFSFVESAKISDIYRSVVNTVVISLMILSLVLIGFKMIVNKNNFDLKSIGLNIVMSVVLIGLMPTLITSGINFAKTFYGDTTSLSASNSNLSWTLIEDGVTDLVLINKNNSYSQLETKNLERNTLNKDYFFSTNFSEVLTSRMITEMKKDNLEAENFNYELTINATGDPEAIKISDGFLAVFSDSFKSGYFRYKVNFFSVLISLLALSVAYLFSLFVILTSILELAFKKIVGVLVFATDIETGQKSKMVLSDILQCYLTIGFQGLGLSFFSFFISFLSTGSGSSVNSLIKVIAYVCAVFSLIKGSSTIMRYFGVDIGVAEGFGKLSTTLALGSMAFRNGRKGSTDKAEKGSNDSEPQKNFGPSIQDRANKATHGLAYARERGFKGLAKDGLQGMNNQVNKPVNTLKTTAKGLRKSAEDGTSEAIRKNMVKPLSNRPDESSKNSMDNLENTRLARKSQLPSENIGYTATGNDQQKRAEANANKASVQEQIKQDLKQRIIKVSEGETDKSREAFVRERMERATANIPQTRAEMLKERAESSNDNERVIKARENIQNSGSSVREQVVNVKENIQNATMGKLQQKKTVEERNDNANMGDKTSNIIVKETRQTDGLKTQTEMVNVKEVPLNQNSLDQEQVIHSHLKQEGNDSFTIRGNKITNEIGNDRTSNLNNEVKNIRVIEELETITQTNNQNNNVRSNSLSNNPLFARREKNPLFDD